MTIPSASISIQESAHGRLGPSAPPDTLPPIMTCPHGHTAQRHVIVDGALTVPFYLCTSCQIVYRFQECRLLTDVVGPNAVSQEIVGM